MNDPIAFYPGKVVVVFDDRKSRPDVGQVDPAAGHRHSGQPGSFQKVGVDQVMVGLGVAAHQLHHLQIFSPGVVVNRQPAVLLGDTSSPARPPAGGSYPPRTRPGCAGCLPEIDNNFDPTWRI
jgi:hypothetical protein